MLASRPDEKTYAQNDIVRVGNRLYQQKRAVPLNASPPDATYRADIGRSIETANAWSGGHQHR